MLKAVIFDFDGTIVDTESLWYEIYFEYFKQHFQYELPLELFAKGIGTANDAIFQGIEHDLGIRLDRREIRKDLIRRFENREGFLEIRQGVLPFIREAHEKGLPLAIATSSGRDWVEKHLKRFRLDAYFSVIKTKDDVREVKPDPELYLRVLEALRLKPEEAVAIEDSVNGSTAALRAGIPCYIIPNRVTKGSRFPEQAVVLDDFCRIPLADLLDA